MSSSRFLVCGCLVTFTVVWFLFIFNDYPASVFIYYTFRNSRNVNGVAVDDEDEVTMTSTLLHPFDRCILPNFDPWDEEIIPFMDQNHDPLKECNRSFKPMTKLKDGIISVETTENVTCYGRCLLRKTERLNKIGRWVKVDEANFRCDIVESLCTHGNGSEVYQMVHAQIIEKTVGGQVEGSSGVLILSCPDLVLFDFSPTKWHVGSRKGEPVEQNIHPLLFHKTRDGRSHRRGLSSNRG
uniref:Uncharacterized protein n=1 Tax=Angiostrongylus cantonensis TaxID=6313 RepID=A0A0K0DDV4_ANGCA